MASAFSYTIVTDDAVTSGTDYTGVHDSPEQLAAWHRERTPDATSIAVWAGELDDRPTHLPQLAGVA